MREVVDDVQFKKGERVTLYKHYGEKFIVRASVDKDKIMRERTFVKHKDAEDFYDSFLEGQHVREFLNKMLKEVNKAGKYKAVLI